MSSKRRNEILANLQQIDLNKIDKVCCGALEAYRSAGFTWPFERPFILDRKDMTLKSGNWYVALMPGLPSGKPDASSKMTTRMNFCPFCGKEFETEAHQ
jgi:hypothetical protein